MADPVRVKLIRAITIDGIAHVPPAEVEVSREVAVGLFATCRAIPIDLPARSAPVDRRIDRAPALRGDPDPVPPETEGQGDGD